MTGIDRIQKTFTSVREQGRAALMPYYTAGYPTLPLSLEILAAIARSGADLIELGVPFSDPLADGPTIQRSTQIALENGASLPACLEIVRELRQRGVAQPLILMGYYNPILAYGIERFAPDAAAAGVDGLIVPDLPPEEAGELEIACRKFGLALVYLLAPTSTPERIASIAGHTTGFLYLVSLTGVTGARQELPADLSAFIERAKAAASTPVAVGFGISTPQQARQVGSLADGVIIGSALINAVDSAADPCEGARVFVSGIRAVLEEHSAMGHS